MCCPDNLAKACRQSELFTWIDVCWPTLTFTYTMEYIKKVFADVWQFYNSGIEISVHFHIIAWILGIPLPQKCDEDLTITFSFETLHWITPNMRKFEKENTKYRKLILNHTTPLYGL